MRDTHSIRFISIKAMLLLVDVIVCLAGMYEIIHMLPLNAKDRSMPDNLSITHTAITANINATHSGLSTIAREMRLANEAIFSSRKLELYH